ncbi:nucleotide kinase domain-containing protein [Hyalangium sp.]|uniref:nucleotide kinase domain-containing protein n=1 Tax=Hyalangium sp. TaxID=2028555 RepID=UPI002D3DD845|nr:nucleotide kinase domain-containing protein [Hyalangium sp.]HYH95909.1 nucleotide kinase domain-containing protein [Hyalangium sp.]
MSRNTPAGRLIVLEGPDGVGKSTISAELVRDLSARGHRAELVVFPGRETGTLGHLVYEIHHDAARFGLRSMTAAANETLHIAAHLDVIERRIVPTLRQGTTVILDRFWWSTLVYGTVVGMDRKVLEALIAVERLLWGSVLPDVMILLRREVPIDRDEPLSQWLRLRDEYDRLAKQEGGNYPVVVIENGGALTKTLAEVRHVLESGTARMGAPADTPTAAQLSIGFAAPQRPVRVAPTTYVHLHPVKPTAAYDTYWRFAVERQNIFFKRFRRELPPWTSDRILTEHKFTNAYRASDRVSQYLIRRVIYRDDLSETAPEVFFRIILFKIFNKIETWELLERRVGAITLENYSFARFDKILTDAQSEGKRIYSAAYIMPSGSSSLGHAKKHRNHLQLIERMIAGDLPQRLTDARTMQAGFALLRAYPTIGNFLAYQYITDINYSELTDFSEMEFVVPGPGALDGIRKCFTDLGGLNESEIIKFIADRQEQEFDRLELKFQSLWGRRLQLIDCQNLFCEVDKYARVHHPEIVGVSGRTRIKQRFTPHQAPLTLWYPPKWKINESLAGDTGAGPTIHTASGTSAHQVERS